MGGAVMSSELEQALLSVIAYFRCAYNKHRQAGGMPLLKAIDVICAAVKETE